VRADQRAVPANERGYKETNVMYHIFISLNVEHEMGKVGKDHL
jgi:hypothetical protein